MKELPFVGLAFVSGLIIAVYLPMNAELSRYLHSPLLGNICFFIGALVTSLCVFAVFGKSGDLQFIRGAPWYLFLAGIAGAAMVLSASLLVPKLGARKMFILLLAGQLLMATVISHYGILGSPKDPITLRKVAGACIMLAGSIIAVI